MTSFLERMRAKMTGSLAKPVATAPAEKSRTTLVTNRFDERIYTNSVRPNVTVDSLIYDLEMGDEHRGGTRTGFEPAAELVHDLSMALYKADPTLIPATEVAREVYPVHKLIKEILENPRLQELQEVTANDPLMTLLGVKAMSDTVREFIGRIPPPPPPPQPKPEGKGDKDEDGDGAQESEDGEPGGGAGEEPGDGDGTAGQPGEGEGEADGGGESTEGEGGEGEPSEEESMEADWQAMFDELLKDLDIERVATKALDAATDEVEELETLRRGIGLEDAEWQTMSPEQRLAMADRLRTPEMKLLAEAIGQMKRYALGIKASRIIDVPHEAYTVEAGNDIRRVLPSELALLATPETSYEFYRRYADRQLLQLKLRGKELVGKGPIVACIDKSGSMNGGPFTWAMAVAESLRRFAAEEDRDYCAIFFGTNSQRVRFDFPGGKGPFEKVLAFLSVKADGGTAFDGVLDEAMQAASTTYDTEGKGKADILFITDGLASLTPEWIAKYNAERQRVGVRQFSVYIGNAGDMVGRTGPEQLLAKISDVVIPVRDLRPQAVKEVFERV